MGSPVVATLSDRGRRRDRQEVAVVQGRTTFDNVCSTNGGAALMMDLTACHRSFNDTMSLDARRTERRA